MRLMIIGSNRLGATLAAYLTEAGHDLVVVDKDPVYLERVHHLSCESHVGLPIDVDVLSEAGIEGCEAVVAVTDDENINVMAAQIARERFGVPHGIVRIFKQANVATYQALGLTPVSQTEVLTDALMKALGFVAYEEEVEILGHRLHMAVRDIPEGWEGRKVAEIEAKRGVKVLRLVHGTETREAEPDAILQAGDQALILIGEAAS